MIQPAHKLRSTTGWPTSNDLKPGVGIRPAETEGSASDPFYYGWRDTWVKTPEGQETLQRIPLNYDDLLDPQVGDYIAEDTVHGRVIRNVARLLEHYYDEHPTVAVWSDLKIAFKIPGLTTGPAPDICVVEGVEDRDRRRSSFRYRQESGEIRLAIEVVSKSSLQKDYQGIFEIYNRMEIDEYIVIHPVGFYPDGPFELRGWRRDLRKKRLCPFLPDQQGRLHSRTTGILLGTEAEGYGLLVWNAQTGRLLRTANEERAAQAEERAEQEKRQAEQEKRQAEQEKRQAEQEKRQAEQERKARRAAEVEVERLRAQLQELRGGRANSDG